MPVKQILARAESLTVFTNTKLKTQRNSDLPRVKFPDGSNKALSFEGVVNKLEVWRKKSKNSTSISVTQLDSDYSNVINQINKNYERVNVYDLSNALVQNNFNPGIFCDKQLDRSLGCSAVCNME